MATSNSVSEIGLALTFTLMLMPGAVSRPRSEFGAPGFSKDRSLMYCARMLRRGWAPPLPFFTAPWDALSALAMGKSLLCRATETRTRKSRVGYHARYGNTSFEGV